MDFERREKAYRVIMLTILTIFITFVITFYGTLHFYLGNDDSRSVSLSDVSIEIDRKIHIIREYIDRYYLGEVDEARMAESAIKGFVEGLGDRYTEFLTEEEYRDLMVNVSGDYIGIGIFMTQNREGYVVVLAPIEDTPAEEAGLMTGDIILTVDGVEVNGMDLTLVSRRIMGEADTIVEIEILRDEERFTEVITRRQIIISTIRSEVLANRVGYIQLRTFDGRSATEFERHFNELKEQGIESLIIDIRNNGGGVVEQVLSIAELMVPRNEITMISASRDEETIRRSTRNPIIDMEIVLLINGNSASASEILAGALKDNGAATLIGETTYGKGVMQEIRPLRSGGALKMTIEEFKTPNGNRINEAGVEPHIVVENEINSQVDEQLNRALEFLRR